MLHSFVIKSIRCRSLFILWSIWRVCPPDSLFKFITSRQKFYNIFEEKVSCKTFSRNVFLLKVTQLRKRVYLFMSSTWFSEVLKVLGVVKRYYAYHLNKIFPIFIIIYSTINILYIDNMHSFGLLLLSNLVLQSYCIIHCHFYFTSSWDISLCDIMGLIIFVRTKSRVMKLKTFFGTNLMNIY